MINKIKLLLVLMIIAGCDLPLPPPPPPVVKSPHIKVIKNEATVEGVSLKIMYSNNDDNVACSVDINTIESLQNYKKELEFLMTQLDEAEERMKIYEQSKPTEIDVTGISKNASSSP